MFYTPSGTREEIGVVELAGGKPYQLLVRYQYISKARQNDGFFIPDRRGGVRFGVAPSKTTEEFIGEAVAVAKSVDAVMLFVGLNGGTWRCGFHTFVHHLHFLF